MSRPTPRNLERDEQIYRDTLTGLTQVQLARRYGLSHQRISQIIQRVQSGFVRCHSCGMSTPDVILTAVARALEDPGAFKPGASQQHSPAH